MKNIGHSEHAAVASSDLRDLQNINNCCLLSTILNMDFARKKNCIFFYVVFVIVENQWMTDPYKSQCRPRVMKIWC